MKPLAIIIISWVLRLALAVVFITAGFLKWKEPQDFADAVSAFEVVSNPRLISFIALTLPVFEILLGIAILIPIWQRQAAVSLIGLNLFFIGLLVSTQIRGISVSCSCFGQFLKTDSLTTVIWRDGLFVAMAVVIVILARSKREPV